MKKIIEGRVYNTETAKLLGEFSYSNRRDFNYFSEKLYRTKSGAYFLYGEGPGQQILQAGRAKQMDRRRGDPRYVTTRQEHGQRNILTPINTQIFGEPEEAGDERVALNLTISATTKAKLEKMREDTGKSMSQIVEDMILAE